MTIIVSQYICYKECGQSAFSGHSVMIFCGQSVICGHIMMVLSEQSVFCAHCGTKGCGQISKAALNKRLLSPAENMQS